MDQLEKACRDEIDAYRNGDENRFPVALVHTVLQTVDAAVPELLEKRILTITDMYLKGAKCNEISAATGIHPAAVEAELRRLEMARKFNYQEHPEVALEVVEKHFDVVACSEDLIKRSLDVLTVVETEIGMDHKLKKDAMADYMNDQCGKTRDAARKTGVSPLKLQAFTQVLEAIGKHQDRIGEVLGLMRGKDNIQVTQNVANFSFNNDKLNELADHFMRSVGAIPITAISEDPDPPAPYEMPKLPSES
jgi:hypothetical protein